MEKHDPEDPVRLSYWNEIYADYWKRRVAEANRGGEVARSAVVQNDSKTTSDAVYAEAIESLAIGTNDSVLELGCGFGRSLPMLAGRAGRVAAVDISDKMIEMAREAHDLPNVEFHVSPSEKLPFAPDTFDVVICFAAFDAMFQSAALLEMSRVARQDARILLTGKNDDYLDDDEAAIAAEIGARAKGHPNYFTDVAGMLEGIDRFGFAMAAERYFVRRGDLPDGRFVDRRPPKFYEYLLVLRKVSNARENAPEVAGSFSRTFARRSNLGQRS